MPRIGMEPLRRAALVEAAIGEIAEAGAPDVTVAGIARRAGMSPALAHHYFGSKDRMLLAAMRHVLSLYAAEVRGALAMADGPRARLEAIVRSSFTPSNFRDEVVAAWLAFYARAHRDPEVRRLLHVYHARLRSNLVHALRPLMDPPSDGATARPDALAEGIAAMIDGLYVRQALRREALDPAASTRLVLDHIARALP